MKVLFIVKPYIIDLLGIGYLSASIKEEGYSTDIYRIKDSSKQEVAKLKLYIQKHNINIVAYSCITGDHTFFLDINRRIKKNIDVFSIFGGPHCTYFPEVIKEDGVDIVFRGESENSIKRVLKNITSYLNRIVDPEFVDINKTAFPDRDLIYKFKENKNNTIRNIITSRGCPFSCGHCYNSLYKKEFGSTKLRYRTVSNIIAEAVALKYKYPNTKVIFFEDDEFACNRKRLKEFAERWKLEVNLPYHCQVRIDRVDEEIIKLLKYSGCISVTFAIETANKKMREKYLNRYMKTEKIIKGAELLRKHKLKFRVENMIGLPYETIEEALNTLDLNIKCKPTLGWVSLYQPYIRTSLGEYCVKQGIFDGDVTKIPKSFFESSILKCFTKTEKKELQNLQRLFGLIVSYPILRPIVRLLLKFPNNGIYDKIYTTFKNRKYDNELYKI